MRVINVADGTLARSTLRSRTLGCCYDKMKGGMTAFVISKGIANRWLRKLDFLATEVYLCVMLSYQASVRSVLQRTATTILFIQHFSIF